MDIDLRKVRYFVAVADLLHFGRAAESLHIAQPVLSRQIRSLEQDIGLDLLTRDRRSVALTPAGRQFLDDARSLLGTARAARARMYRAARGESRLTVGFDWGLPVAGLVAAFTEAHPGVGVDLRRVGGEAALDEVLSGTLDVALVRDPTPRPGVRLAPWGSEPLVAAVPGMHRWARLPGVGAAALAEERLLRRDSVEETLELVVGGAGVALVPACAATLYRRAGLVYLPVAELPPQRVCLARAETDSSELSRAFLATVTSHAPAPA
jgi:DNA-binding transcriptional LysR family regulator